MADDQPEVVDQFTMRDIDPVQIAEALHGELQEIGDLDSTCRVLLPSGLVLTLHPEKRTMMLLIPCVCASDGFVATVKLRSVADLLFTEYYRKQDSRLETDIQINVRSEGLITEGLILSSYAHTIQGH